MDNLYTAVSPGTYISELDLSTRARIATSTIGGIVMASKVGPVDLTFVSSGQEFIERFGEPDPSVSFGHDCALAALTEMRQLWVKRVTNGALYGGTTYFVDRNSGYALTASRRIVAPFIIGNDQNYKDSGGKPGVLLSFAGPLVALNSFTMSITDGATVTNTTPVVFTTNHNTTMTAIAAAINTALATFASGGTAIVHTETDDDKPNNFIIRILPPPGVSLSYGTPAITLGATQTTAVVDTEARLFDVMQENPGRHGKNIGIRITNVDVGIRQRYRMVFSGPLVASNSFTIRVNGRTIGPITYATNSDATMAAIAAALQADADIETATVETVPGPLDNDRAINIIASQSSPGFLVITGGAVTLGSSQPIVLVTETQKGILPTGEFDLEVYTRSNTLIPVEKIRCTLGKQVSEFGVQLAMDKRVNAEKGAGSNYIRLVYPETTRSYKWNPVLQGSVYVVDKTINWLDGGDDGATVLNSQIAAGWSSMSNREIIPVRILINAGYTDPFVQQTMIALAEKRYDSFAVLDMPSDKQTPQAAYLHRLTAMNIDSSYGALYTSDIQINDDKSDELRFIPPSGHVSACYAYSDKVAGVWFAPAGLNRGKLKRVRGLRVDYDLGHRDLLTPVGVNCIINKPGAGPTIWGEETLQMKKSVLSSVHSRRLLNSIEVAYADALDYVALFEPNNVFARIQATALGEDILKPLLDAGALYAYEVKCDDQNNTPEVIDADAMRVDFYVQIVRTAKRILLRAILTRTGALFSETIELVN